MKNQKGFTLTELIIFLGFLAALAVAGFIGYAVVYAIGKYLFGWWG